MNTIRALCVIIAVHIGCSAQAPAQNAVPGVERDSIAALVARVTGNSADTLLLPPVIGYIRSDAAPGWRRYEGLHFLETDTLRRANTVVLITERFYDQTPITWFDGKRGTIYTAEWNVDVIDRTTQTYAARGLQYKASPPSGIIHRTGSDTDYYARPGALDSYLRRCIGASLLQVPSVQWEGAEWASDLCVSPDGSMLLSFASTSASVWSMATHERIATFRFNSIFDAAFTPDSRQLILATIDSLGIYDIGERRLLKPLAGGWQSVLCLASAPAKGIAVSAGHDVMQWWTVAADKAPRAGARSKGRAACVAFSNDGALLACGGEESDIALWNAATKRRLSRLDVSKYNMSIADIGFSHDGRLLGCTTDYAAIRLWDVAEKRRLVNPRTKTVPVRDMAFSPVEPLLASCHGMTITLWSLPELAEIATFYGHNDIIVSIAFTPDGTRMASVDASGNIRIWRVEDLRPRARE